MFKKNISGAVPKGFFDCWVSSHLLRFWWVGWVGWLVFGFKCKKVLKKQSRAEKIFRSFRLPALLSIERVFNLFGCQVLKSYVKLSGLCCIVCRGSYAFSFAY